jgi:hypothetical protein
MRLNRSSRAGACRKANRARAWFAYVSHGAAIVASERKELS